MMLLAVYIKSLNEHGLHIELEYLREEIWQKTHPVSKANCINKLNTFFNAS